MGAWIVEGHATPAFSHRIKTQSNDCGSNKKPFFTTESEKLNYSGFDLQPNLHQDHPLWVPSGIPYTYWTPGSPNRTPVDGRMLPASHLHPAPTPHGPQLITWRGPAPAVRSCLTWRLVSSMAPQLKRGRFWRRRGATSNRSTW